MLLRRSDRFNGRIVRFDADAIGWADTRLSQSPYAIYDFQELKTVWHPMGM